MAYYQVESEQSVLPGSTNLRGGNPGRPESYECPPNGRDASQWLMDRRQSLYIDMDDHLATSGVITIVGP